MTSRISRRTVLRGLASLPVAATVLRSDPARAAAPAGSAIHTDHQVAEGHRAQLLVGWGDPIVTGAEPLDLGAPSSARQAGCFGTNCDFIALFPHEDGYLLVVNHETCDHALMWPGARETAEHTAMEKAAHGISVLRVRKAEGRWQLVPDPRSRRITVDTTCRISGPAAGHPRLRTSADPEGRTVLGTLHNCSGGVTPWGTALSGEENIYYYFRGPAERAVESERRNYEVIGLRDGSRWPWWQHDRRFDVAEEPHEPNRFGWVVEVDPYQPDSRPVKRTALGRFCHEGATVVPAGGGRVAVYMGDDARDQFLYRFLSEDTGRDALDRGTLSVARFEGERLLWLPLVHGAGPLTQAEGFADQAEVLIECRRAAKLLGATPLDRPERIDVDPTTGDVYAVLTGNSRREEPNAAGPRAPNPTGHVLRIAAGDHTAEENPFVIHFLGGPAEEPDQVQNPDNCAIDPHGRLWLCTDGASYGGAVADGVHLVEGDTTWRLYSAPTGAEVTGPAFTPDGRSLFLSVQHPGEGSTWEEPSTRWPDFREGRPPRASIVVIEREDGGILGP